MGLEGTMTVKEADRAALIAAVVEKRVKQQSGFADLSGLPHHQRLAPRLRSPLPEVVDFVAMEKPLHGARKRLRSFNLGIVHIK